MILPIIYYGNRILRTKCEPIVEITPEIIQLAHDMVETMDANDGAGIAAPQVGRSVRMFILRNYIFHEDGRWSLSPPQCYINPVITNVGTEETEVEIEGCLSIPRLREKVKRPLKLTVEATDLTGARFVEEIVGYKARMILHENDHLNGVLYIDRIDPKRRKKIEPLLRALEKEFSI